MPSQVPPARLVAASEKLPANPHLLDPPVNQAETAAPSLASPSATTTQTQKLLRNRLLRLGQFCAVTGSATATLQACHILNPVRKKKSETAEDARRRKEAIENFLTNLGILKREPFLLNSLFNMCLLKTDIHYIWDKCASIVFCPALQTIIQLTNYFDDCNAVWQRHADREHTIPPQRPAVVQGGNSLRACKFDFFVLHATSFLPHGEPIFVCMDPPYLDAQHSTINAPSIWEAYRYDSTTSKLVGATGTATPLAITVRHGDLSTVAVILNADAKIEHAQESGWRLSPEVLQLKEAIDSFKLHFFFLPTLDGESSRRTASDNSNATEVTNMHPPSCLLQDGLRTSKPSHNHVDEDGQETGSENEGSEYEDEEDEEDDDEASGSLSPEEYKLGLKKVVDPSIPIQERMQIGSLLFIKRHLPLPPRT
ncbi:hypothetical protein C8R44DRAFT_891134 [Mycena epipterygia]|nr:hypothetical protein C8R44DRAFT_891134 [Mycena epipterygia]